MTSPRKTMRRILPAVLTLACAALQSLEWPVSPAMPSTLFGGRDGQTLSRGLVFSATDTVRTAGPGTVLITLRENRNLTGFPTTLGNTAVVAHEEGLTTVYGNLASLDRLEGTDAVEGQMPLGPAGTGAWGTEGEVRFQVLDRDKKTVLNPLLLLTPLRDTKAPRIREVSAVSEGGQNYALGTSKYLKQGRYRLYADVSDSLDGSQADLAPFRITVLVNGKEQSVIAFELLKEDGGALYLSQREFTAGELYRVSGKTLLGEVSFVRGQTDLVIAARDIAGNERSAQFSLIIE